MYLNLPAGRRFAHGSRTGFERGERGNAAHSLGLAVPLTDGRAGLFLPDLYDFRNQRFAGAGAMTEGGKIELPETRRDQHPVNGRGAAEGNDLVLLPQGEELR